MYGCPRRTGQDIPGYQMRMDTRFFDGSCWVKACEFLEVLHYRYPVFSGADSLFLLSWSTARFVQRPFRLYMLQRPALPVQLDSQPGVLQ